MKMKLIASMVLFVLIAAACAPATPTADAMMEKPTEAMMETPTEEMMAHPTEEMMTESTESMDAMPTDSMAESTEAMDSMSEDAMMAPAWVNVALTNVNTGASFKISDYLGKVVLVENLAMWCPTCKSQQQQIISLHKTLGMDSDLVTVGLDIDPNEVSADLKAYTTANEFDWIYAVAPPEVTAEFGKLYNAQYLNPPSAPILVIDRKGGVHELPFGLKSADDLKTYLDPFLSEGM